jgi:hypothetical protein
MATETKRAMARKRARAKAARAMAMVRKRARAARAMATAKKRAMVRKRARAQWQIGKSSRSGRNSPVIANLYVQIGLYQIPLTSRVVQFSLIAHFWDAHGGSGRRTGTNKEQPSLFTMSE